MQKQQGTNRIPGTACLHIEHMEPNICSKLVSLWNLENLWEICSQISEVNWFHWGFSVFSSSYSISYREDIWEMKHWKDNSLIRSITETLQVCKITKCLKILSNHSCNESNLEK